MRQYFLHLLLLASTIPAYAQNSISQKATTGKSLEDDRWNLDKYVWSHTHYKTSRKDKPVIDFDAIDNWTGIGDPYDLSISPDGKYFTYGIKRIATEHRDSFIVQSTSGSWRRSFEGEDVKPGFFTADSKQYIFQDKEGLCFLQTGSGELQNIKGVLNYTLPASSTISGIYQWLAYQLPSKEVVLQERITGKEKRIENVAGYNFDKKGEWLVCRLNNANSELLLYNLSTGVEKHFPGVAGYVFDKSSKLLLLKTVEKLNDVSTTSLQYVNLADGATDEIWSTSEKNNLLNSYAFDNSGNQVVFVVKDSMSSNSIWYWKKGISESVQKVNNQTAGIENGLLIPGSASFTENGKYIYFSLQSKPDLRKPDPDAVKLDIWSYKDSILQSSQPFLSKEPVSYNTVLNLETDKLTQLVKESEKLVFIMGDFGVIKKIPTSGDRFWEDAYDRNDYLIVSLKDDSRRLLPAKEIISALNPSPGRNFFVFLDTAGGGNYFSYNLRTGKIVLMSSGLAFGRMSYKNDYLLTKQKLPVKTFLSHQIIGWVDGESGFLVSDNFDIWQLDPSGIKAPINITNGYGRLHQTQFFLSDWGGWHYFASKDTLLLGAFNKQNKFNGFYRKVLGTSGNPELLYMGPCFFDAQGIYGMDDAYRMKPLKAASADVWIVQRQTATDAPNYFVTQDFKNYKTLTDFQLQKNYNWFTTELHNFKQLNGVISQGILYKPENFDPKKKYPVIIPFYLQHSDQLYQYPMPGYIDAPDFSDNPAWMASHGYLVFVPDIYFTAGEWGPSTVNAIDGAARYLRTLSYVEHLAACGHSNSGRFGYYLLTHSHSFAAMSIGAGTTDVISAGLRLTGGDQRSVLEQFERSALGAGGLGSLWKNKELWLDHTPVLQADKVTIPVLIFHNRPDGAFLAGNALEIFNALRRLEKPVWWLQYDEGGHRVQSVRDKRDFTIRTTQFYDHYLKGAPAPTWMTNGIPYKLKGIESRYELDPSGTCALAGKECPVCKAWNAQYKRYPAMFEKPISEWKLDDDIKRELDKNETERYSENMNGEAERVKENDEKLKGTWKGKPY